MNQQHHYSFILNMNNAHRRIYVALVLYDIWINGTCACMFILTEKQICSLLRHIRYKKQHRIFNEFDKRLVWFVEYIIDSLQIHLHCIQISLQTFLLLIYALMMMLRSTIPGWQIYVTFDSSPCWRCNFMFNEQLQLCFFNSTFYFTLHLYLMKHKKVLNQPWHFFLNTKQVSCFHWFVQDFKG